MLVIFGGILNYNFVSKNSPNYPTDHNWYYLYLIKKWSYLIPKKMELSVMYVVGYTELIINRNGWNIWEKRFVFVLVWSSMEHLKGHQSLKEKKLIWSGWHNILSGLPSILSGANWILSGVHRILFGTHKKPFFLLRCPFRGTVVFRHNTLHYNFETIPSKPNQLSFFFSENVWLLFKEADFYSLSFFFSWSKLNQKNKCSEKLKGRLLILFILILLLVNQAKPG